LPSKRKKFCAIAAAWNPILQPASAW